MCFWMSIPMRMRSKILLKFARRRNTDECVDACLEESVKTMRRAGLFC